MVKVTSFTNKKIQKSHKSTPKRSKSSFLQKDQTNHKFPLRSDNPFDKFANSRKKHDILNRRVKGEDRDVGRAKNKVSIRL